MKNNELIALEIQLATALGWKNVFQLNTDAIGDFGGVYFREPVPQWTRDWRACGPLMVEHGVYPAETMPFSDPGRIMVNSHGVNLIPGVIEWVEHHKDRDTAVRVAICRAVLAKLKAVNV